MDTAISPPAAAAGPAFQGQDEILALEQKEEARLEDAKRKFEKEEQKTRQSEEEKRAAAEQAAKDKARAMLQSVAEKDVPAVGAAHDQEAEKECAELKKAFAKQGDTLVASLAEEFVSLHS